MPALPTLTSLFTAALTLGLLICACDGDAKSSTAKSKPSQKGEVSKPAKEASPEQAKPSNDPKLLAICRAYDEVVAAGTAKDIILQSAAVTAVQKHGVTEAELSTYGASPAALLKSIQDRGDPPECAAFVTALKAMN